MEITEMPFNSIVFEDDLFVSTAMSRSLNGEGFTVKEVNTPLSRSLEAPLHDAQLVIIGSKEDFCNLSRFLVHLKAKAPQAGVVILKENYKKEELLDLFNMGIDLFIEKPFDIDVVINQLVALRRRLESGGCRKYVGDILLNIGEQFISCGDSIVDLNPSEVKLMSNLIDNVGVGILTKQDINQLLYRTDTDIGVSSAKVYIYRLRDKLSKVGAKKVTIENHYGNGYYLQVED
jgi:two-component system, OmpR family, response regulator